MITKAIIKSINKTGTRCRVRMPLFETAGNKMPAEATALVNITPGMFNNLVVGDVVFVGFEENAIEKPIILGKLFRGAKHERDIRGGGAVVDTLKVNSSVVLPASTSFGFSDTTSAYEELDTMKKLADYVKDLEERVRVLEIQLKSFAPGNINTVLNTNT